MRKSKTKDSHPINALCDVLNTDMAKYWTPTRETYLNHVSKARIVEVVSNAVSPEAAAQLAAMKKGEAAAAAEIRLSESGWIPEVLTNREAATVHSYEIEDEDANEASAEEDTDEV
jgi:ParB family chromosome partitioning protein